MRRCRRQQWPFPSWEIQDRVPVDLDDLIQSVLGLMRVELEKKKIIVQNELTGPIPSVMVHGGQLQQVILNLIRNAGEAMDAVSNRERVLRVRSAIHNTNEVLVSIEDSDRRPSMRASS